MGKFFDILTIILYILGTIALFYDAEIALVLWAVPVGFATGSAIQNLIHKDYIWGSNEI